MITIGFFNYLDFLLLTLFKHIQEVAPESNVDDSHDPPKLSQGVVATEIKPHWIWTVYG